MVWTEDHSEHVAAIHRLDAEIKERAEQIQWHLRGLVKTNPLGFSAVAYGFEQDAVQRAQEVSQRADVIDRDTDRFAELSGWREWLVRQIEGRAA